MDRQAKILIVDDDADFSRISQAALEKASYEVAVAFSGEEGRQKAKELKPDLIVLDAMMETQTEGFHVVYDLRRDPELKDVPILMLTSINTRAYPWRLDKDETWLPVDSFVDKPISSDNLVSEVTRVLEAKKKAGE